MVVPAGAGSRLGESDCRDLGRVKRTILEGLPGWIVCGVVESHWKQDWVRVTVIMVVVEEEDLVVGGGDHECDRIIRASIRDTLRLGATIKNIVELLKGVILGRMANEGRFPRGDGR